MKNLFIIASLSTMGCAVDTLGERMGPMEGPVDMGPDVVVDPNTTTGGSDSMQGNMGGSTQTDNTGGSTQVDNTGGSGSVTFTGGDGNVPEPVDPCAVKVEEDDGINLSCSDMNVLGAFDDDQILGCGDLGGSWGLLNAPSWAHTFFTESTRGTGNNITFPYNVGSTWMGVTWETGEGNSPTVENVTSVTFYAKASSGPNNIKLGIHTQQTIDENFTGYTVGVQLSNEWMKYTVPFCSMSRPGNIGPEVDTNNLRSVMFLFEEQGDYDVLIDDVAFE